MKFTTTALFSLLAATISAAPSALDSRNAGVDIAVIALANDQTGAQGSAPIPTDGVERSINALYGNTNVGRGGVVLASSAQLTKIPTNVRCLIKFDHVVVELNSQKTFADLDGNPGVAIPVNLNGGVVSCVC